jgi:S-adenosylmethionine-dependent methyltransferase
LSQDPTPALTAGDPRLKALHQGHPAPSPAWDNLVGALRAWREHPDWMDFLDPSAPNHKDKMVERALYLDRWGAWLEPGMRVLEVGCGVGRFTTRLLELGCSVDAVEPDLRSLERCLHWCADLPGSLRPHWTSVEYLPNVQGVDLVLAPELLCYVDDPAAALAALVAKLRPGGHLLLSVEARWGWALAPDAIAGTLGAFLGDGIVHVPQDRFVRTFSREAIEALLDGLEVRDLHPSHYALSGPLESAAGPLGVGEALELEAQLREHPAVKHLNRAWMVVVRRPG